MGPLNDRRGVWRLCQRRLWQHGGDLPQVLPQLHCCLPTRRAATKTIVDLTTHASPPRRYDASGDGTLDAAELARAAEDLGFAAFAGDLFCELDADGSGTVDYRELIANLGSRGSCIAPASRHFLIALASAHSTRSVDLHTSSWVLTTDGVEPLRAQLNALLAAHKPPARATDLFAVMSRGNKRRLTRAGLRRGLEAIGFPGTHA